MEFIKPGININFIGHRMIAVCISLAVIAISIISLIMHGGPNYGVDFEGGTQIQVKLVQDMNIEDLRKFVDELNLGSASVQRLGPKGTKDYIIKFKISTSEMEGLQDKISQRATEKYGKEALEISQVVMVGPKVSGEMRQKGFWAIIMAMIGILIYVTWRFEIKYASGAILALVHDVVITLGIFSILSKEITLPIIAAFLTIIGYSLNDTIIVFDRIRENLRQRRKEGFDQIINSSINQTLSRTILTSGTTMLVVLSLYLFGGYGDIHEFSFALIIGVLVGTYSSIYVASPTLIFWENRITPLFEKAKSR